MKWYKSIVFKLILGIFLIIFIFLLSIESWISYSQTKEFVEHATDSAGKTSLFIKDQIEKEMLKKNKLENIRTLINALAMNSNIDKIMLINLEGEVRHSSDSSLIGYRFIRDEHEGCMVCHNDIKKVPPNRTALTIDHRGKKIIRTTLPLKNNPPCYSCHPSGPKNRGMLVIDTSFYELEHTLKSITEKLQKGIGIAIIFLIIAVAIFLKVYFSIPLNRLIQGIKEIRNGNLNYKITEKGDDEMAFVSKTFNQMTVDLDNYVREIKQKNLELNALYSTVDKLSRTMDINELCSIIIDIFISVFNINSVYMTMYVFGKDELEITSKTKGEKQKKYIGTVTSIYEKYNTAIYKKDFYDFVDGKLTSVRLSEDRNRLIIPLLLKDEHPLGFVLTEMNKGEAFDEFQQKTVTAIAGHIAIAVSNARLYSQTITDDLTQLYTKRYFLIRGNENIHRYLRYGEEFSIMMIDIDKFKNINDTYGHMAGDIVIKHFADILKMNTRSIDVCARYAGDEFIVLLPSINTDQAIAVAEKVRNYVENEKIPVDENITCLNITLSIGIASCPLHSKDLDDLISKTDTALYKSKEMGRNKVSIYTV